MRKRRLLAATAVVLGSGLMVSPAIASADTPLETMTVDAGSTSVKTSATQLEAGTHYRLQVSGTFVLANGFGQSFTEDALYCFGDQGFDSPQCKPPVRMGDFYIGPGSSPSALKNIDAFQFPGGGGSTPGYSDANTYTVDYYPPASGPLGAGGTLAKSQCKSQPTPCTTSVSGTITIQIFGPSSGGGGGGAGSGWVIGGPIELQSWPTFCRVQKGPQPVVDAPVATKAQSTGCVLTELLDANAEAQMREDLRDFVVAAAYWCGLASADRNVPARNVLYLYAYKVLCEDAVKQVVATYNLLPHRFTASDPGPSAAAAAAARCPRPLSKALCTAVTSYRTVLSYTTSVIGDVHAGANQVASAVKANSPLSAFFQEAFAKINEGSLAIDLNAQPKLGKALTKLLHLPGAAPVSRVKSAISRLPSSVLSKANRKFLIGQLAGVSGKIGPSAVGAAVPHTAFAAQYRSISLRDLASLVNAFVRLNHFSLAVGQKLVGDLAGALAVCGNPGQRIAAMNRFVADALAKAGSDGPFLRNGAQPLLATTVPASACS